MRRTRKKMNSSLYVHRRNCRRDTEQNGNRELIGKRGFVTSWHRKLGLQEDLPSDDGRCNRTIHLFAALHGHTPIGRNHGVWHRHLEVTSDVFTCNISEAQKFVALVDTLPINGNNMTIFITALQELLVG